MHIKTITRAFIQNLRSYFNSYLIHNFYIAHIYLKLKIHSNILRNLQILFTKYNLQNSFKFQFNLRFSEVKL